MKIPFHHLILTRRSSTKSLIRYVPVGSHPVRKVKALEEEIKSFSGAKEVLCVNSWTSGAIMMLRWLGEGGR